jgi:hypothetical protein
MSSAFSRRIGIVSAGFLLVWTSVRAADLHVPADYPTIAAAVAAARLRTDGSTTILVAPGVYAESGIVLDVPNLTLAGTAPLARGPDGFPLDSLSQPAAAAVRKDLAAGAIMFQVRAANVRITQLVLDGLRPNPPPIGPGQGGFLISIDGALSSSDGFSIDGNVLQAAAQGITSRMASGTIQGNRLTLMLAASAVFGGRPEHAKSVVFRDNLVIGNANVGAAFQGGNGSRNPPQVPSEDGPGSLSAEVSGNEFRGNGLDQANFANVGLSFVVNDDSRSDATEPARLEADVHDNLFIENRHWGLAVLQRIAPNARVTGFEFEGTFERNRYCGNGLNAAIFAFRQVTTTLGGGTVKFRYGRGSTYVIHAENDLLASIGFDMDHPAIDPDPHNYTNPTEHEDAGAPLGNTLIFNGAVVPTAEAPVLRRTTPVVGCTTRYLRATGPDANPSDLFLGSAPSAATPKYRDSAGIKFSGGNVFKEIGTWTAIPAAGNLTSAGDLYTWIGLKNSDDQGTRFDLRVELYRNGLRIAEGLTRCIPGVTRNANSALAVTVGFDPFPATAFTGADVLGLKVLTRIGTNPDGTACGGHANAAGLRLYFDSTNRPSSFDQNP